MATVTFEQIHSASCHYWSGGNMDWKEYGDFCACVDQALKNGWEDKNAASHALRAAYDIKQQCKQYGIAL